MDKARAAVLLRGILAAVETPNGVARTDEFQGLRQVDAKVREARMIIGDLPGFGERLAADMAADPDFEANSRRVRLEALGGYCHSVLRLFEAGAIPSGKKTLVKAPKSLSKITSVMPDLGAIIQDRWLEAQKCQHAGAYLAAVVMMGSILEALLLARAQMSPADAYRATAAPKRRHGGQVPLHEWTLNAFIDVSADLGWISLDRKRFSHALRDSRNVVHPWYQVRSRVSFDRGTCDLCWQVLRVSAQDLVGSL